jgi:HAMP domain-containing protein
MLGARKLRNYLIYPAFLVRTGLFFVLIATNTVLVGKIVIQSVESPILLYFSCLLLLIAVAFVGVWYAHRVTGPMIGIKRTCKLIAAGRHDLRVKLRANDEFGDVALAINEMIDSLQKKNGGPS